MNFLSSSRITSAYTALRGDLIAAPQQTVTDTIDKLVDRIQTSEKVEDRKTAVLGLKGCTREYREEVGERALNSLIAVLHYDAPNDPDIAKAVLETLMLLMEVPEKPARDDPGLRFMDAFFAEPTPTHSLLALIHISPSFYPRFYTLQLLSQLLVHRTPQVQDYLISAPPPGIDGILSVLDPAENAGTSNPTTGQALGGGAGEMLRNEALLLLPGLLAGNADLQKIVAFSGAFEKLLGIIDKEGGIEGGIIVQDVLVAIGSLLRFNASNQNYFRELSLIPLLPPMLYFPSPPPDLETPAPDDFTLQYWPEQKLLNAGLVLGLIRMLVGSPGGGNQTAMATSGVTRCLLELSLSSNAPAALKAQALNTLTPIMQASPPNQSLLSNLSLAPLLAIPADEEHPNGGFIRLSMRPAVVALIGTILEEEVGEGRDLRQRAAGVNMFDAYVAGNDDSRLNILSTMTAPPKPNADGPYELPVQSAGSLILNALIETPLPGRPFDPYRTLFACLLFSHLVRNSEKAKQIARDVVLPSVDDDAANEHGVADVDPEEGDRLMQIIIGNLMMASREQQECTNRAAKDAKTTHAASATALAEAMDWNRVMVSYLIMFCTWLWESPKGVKEFLSDGGNIGVLTQPITQSTGVDPLVQGLSAFLLGVCYEFNREPGEVTRQSLHHILHSRIGPDQFVSRLARVREDARFRTVQPDQFDNVQQTTNQDAQGAMPKLPVGEDGSDDEADLWFDWAFVDFWKNNYYLIQRSIAIDPNDARGASGTDPEAANVINSLRDKIKAQTNEISDLHSKLAVQAKEHEADRATLATEIETLSEQLSSTTLKLHDAEKAGASGTESSIVIQELQDTIDSLTRELEKVTKEAEEGRQRHIKVEQQLLRQEVEHKSALTTLQEQLDEEKAKRVAAERQHEEEESVLKTLQEKLDEEKTRRVAAEKQDRDEESALKALQDQLDEEKSKREASERQKGEEESALKALQEQLDEEKSKREAAEKQTGDQEPELKTLQDQLEQQKAQLEEAKAQLDEEKAKREAVESKVEDVTKQNMDSTKKQEAVIEQNQILTKQHDDLTSKHGGLAKELGTLKSSHETLTKEHEQLTKELEKAKSAASSPAKGGKAAKNEAKNEAKNADKAAELEKQVEEERKKREEIETEHEDLLVLLEELSQKRKADKAKMREKGLEVSEDEDEGDDDDDDE